MKLNKFKDAYKNFLLSEAEMPPARRNFLSGRDYLGRKRPMKNVTGTGDAPITRADPESTATSRYIPQYTPNEPDPNEPINVTNTGKPPMKNVTPFNKQTKQTVNITPRQPPALSAPAPTAPASVPQTPQTPQTSNWRDRLKAALKDPHPVLKGIASAGGYNMSAKEEFDFTPRSMANALAIMDTRGTLMGNHKVYDLTTNANYYAFIDALKRDDADIEAAFRKRYEELKTGRSSKPSILYDYVGGRNIAVRKIPNGSIQAIVTK